MKLLFRLQNLQQHINMNSTLDELKSLYDTISLNPICANLQPNETLADIIQQDKQQLKQLIEEKEKLIVLSLNGNSYCKIIECIYEFLQYKITRAKIIENVDMSKLDELLLEWETIEKTYHQNPVFVLQDKIKNLAQQVLDEIDFIEPSLINEPINIEPMVANVEPYENTEPVYNNVAPVTQTYIPVEQPPENIEPIYNNVAPEYINIEIPSIEPTYEKPVAPWLNNED
ncbi:MAG: hypothetical protein ATN36_05810 [Epulopiscium sp. Nele67-Bin005]|nr:MAG: hypothetical protein ATN36_05810 [Epulopiscium sp. Nele67-Bin005]